MISVKTICNIITSLAAFAFMLSLGMMDGNPTAAVIILLLSGAWLGGYAYVWEENRRERERRVIR